MKMSPSIVEISKALVKAQSKMGAASKAAKNPFFKSKYADLNSVLEACKEPLNSEGIAILQPVVTDEHGTCVETVLLHTSGEYLASSMQVAVSKANDSQALGSAVSYSRRYSLQSLISLPAEDDDGNSATGKPESMVPGTRPAPATVSPTIPLAGGGTATLVGNTLITTNLAAPPAAAQQAASSAPMAPPAPAPMPSGHSGFRKKPPIAQAPTPPLATKKDDGGL